MDLKEKLRMNDLFDIYGDLLTDKQKVYYEYYYLKDYSLSEISEILNVSRNAVHMQLKSVISHLDNYEQKLSVLKNKKKLHRIVKKINNKEITLEEVVQEIEKV